MPEVQTTISPVDGNPVFTVDLPTNEAVNQAVAKAKEASRTWRKVPLEERIQIVSKFVDDFESKGDIVAEQLTKQMGRPIRFTPGEVKGFVERARYLIGIAKSCLADVELKDTDKSGFRRFIRREPIGVVLVIGAWNYPYLILSNSLIPGLLAGNALILKPSPQTPSSSTTVCALLQKAGLPDGVAQTLHLTPDQLDRLVGDPRIGYVQFTGSVANGRRVEKNAVGKSAGQGFKGVGLELGGKDAAYVREDADVPYSAENIADGAFFNSGQSCCAVERVYVHEKVYDEFVEKLVQEAKNLKLGDPRDPATTLGPVISKQAASNIRAHVSDAIEKGAHLLLHSADFPASELGTTYVSPNVLVDVNHGMKIMMDETFGPVVGVMKVKSDEEALHLMNDSPYGLTASVWTNDDKAFEALTEDLDVGTVFMNRCDYLDPALAWTGTKDSGRGVSLSKFGFDSLTRAKSVHVKHPKEVQ